jgi:hypothetical protein
MSDTTLAFTKAELIWLAKIINASPSHQSILRYVRVEQVVTSHGGAPQSQTWAVATDTHRLHCLRLQGDFTVSGLLDIRRLLHELRFYRGADQITVDTTDGTVQVWKSKEGKTPTCLGRSNASCWFADGTPERNSLGTFPNWTRIMPPLEELKDFTEACFNFTYLAEAAALAKDKRVYLQHVSKERPAVITHMAGNPWNQPWFVILMPMAFLEAGKAA